VLNFPANCISWNPMEAYNFAVASEDHNGYIFDMRNMKRALQVLVSLRPARWVTINH
jgi:WD repeat and SOF domain-containing protein 1